LNKKKCASLNIHSHIPISLDPEIQAINEHWCELL